MITIKDRFGRRVKNLRRTKGWTQEKLSEKMDISLNYLSSIERGTENPTFDMLVNLSEALKVEMWELFYFEHETNPEELKKMIVSFANEIDEKKLGLSVKILRAIAR